MKGSQQLQPSLLPFAETTRSSPKPPPRSKKRERDPLLGHAAVKLYRELCHLWPNHVQRQQIASAVSDSSKALELYRQVLTQFLIEGQPKQRADWTVERFLKALQLQQAIASHSDSTFSSEAVGAVVLRLSRALAEASHSRREQRVDRLCRALSDAASRLHAMQSKILGRTVDVRALEESLAVIDRWLGVEVIEAASVVELEAAQILARDHLKKYRDQMNVVAYKSAEERLVQRNLREQFGVPRLTLYP